MLKKRYLYHFITADLKEKMVFLGGPRQVGKTTLARQVGEHGYASHYTYFNWDSREDRAAILGGQRESQSDLFIFDEIHKYRWQGRAALISASRGCAL